MDAEYQGLITPKGIASILDIHAGSSQVYAGSQHLTVGLSQSNAKHLHNICTNQHPTSYVSFSRSEAIAKKFATYDWSEEGWVYVTDTDILNSAGINAYWDIPGLVNPDEEEVLICLYGHEHLPLELIIDKYSVSPN